MVTKVLVGRYKSIKIPFRLRKECSVFQALPSHFKCSGYTVRSESFSEGGGCTLIKEDIHARQHIGYATDKLCSACFKTDSA